MKLDKFDKKILSLMQKDCRLATDSIAEEVGLSISAVQRRLKKLRENAVITGEIAKIDKKYLANSMTFIAGIEIERDNYQTLAQFKNWVKDKDNIQQVHYVTGNIDLMVFFTAENAGRYDAFIEQMMKEFPTIGRVTTNVVLDSPKQSFYTPVSE